MKSILYLFFLFISSCLIGDYTFKHKTTETPETTRFNTLVFECYNAVNRKIEITKSKKEVEELKKLSEICTSGPTYVIDKIK